MGRLNNTRYCMVRCLGILMLVFLPSYTYGWSQDVHTQAGEQSFQLLSKKEKRYYSNLAKHLPTIKGAKLKNKKYKKKFRDMSAWVDSIRDTPIYEVFNGDVPKALLTYEKSHSGRWHYRNHYYYLDKSKKNTCHIRKSGDLLKALGALGRALEQRPNIRQRAIITAFMLHLIEDAHQPLHAISAVRSDCSHDRGGNLYCLQRYNRKCMLNLHQLWDKAFSFGRNVNFWRGIRYSSGRVRPTELHIRAKFLQSQNMASKIYALELHRMPGVAYRKWAESIVTERLSEMVVQNVYFLKANYEIQSSSR